MFEKTAYRCPCCGYEIHQSLSDGDVYACDACRRRYKVLLDEETGKAGFVEQGRPELPEPLHMPRGSIRAIVALGVGACCWVTFVLGREIPGAMLGLALTTVSYYFAFRVKTQAAGSRIFDASAQPVRPLALPGGCIRTILTLGFLVSALAAYTHGRIAEPLDVEFFLVLLGLPAGHVFARVMAKVAAPRLTVLVSHLKGLTVLAATVGLAILVLWGAAANISPAVTTTLCAVVSFYYGSRS